MWLADGWKDYEEIDSSDGEKLERWGQYIQRLSVRGVSQITCGSGRTRMYCPQRSSFSADFVF